MTADIKISVEDLKRTFPSTNGGEDVTVFEDIWFKVEDGEFVCLIGHSGCGKTTLLNILAGLDETTGGVVIVDHEAVTGPSLDRAVVFQGHALMPWMTVYANIAFAVKSRWPDWSKVKIREHCQKYIDLVHLTGSENKKPSQLSGGMKQRVGIAWLVIVAAEMLVGGTGIGYFVWNEWNNLSITNILTAILAIGLIGMTLDLILARLARLVTFPE